MMSDAWMRPWSLTAALPFVFTAGRQLLEQSENRRPDVKLTSIQATRSRGREDTEYTETFTSTRDNRAASSHSLSQSTAPRTPTSRSK